MKNYLKFLSHQKRPLKTILSTFLLKTKLHKLIKIHLRGYKLYFQKAALSRLLWVDPHIRDHDLDFLELYLRVGDTVVDVGANVGFTVLESSKAVGCHGKVYAFEPHPKVFRFLSSNIALNQCTNVHLYNLALGNKPGVLNFLDERSNDRNRPDEKGSTTVEVETLDRILNHVESIELLKVDVEGYEKFVIEGANSILARTESIYFEVCESFTKHFGYSALELIHAIQISGFSLFRLDEQLYPEPLLYDFEPEPNQVIDILGVRDINNLKIRLKLVEDSSLSQNIKTSNK